VTVFRRWMEGRICLSKATKQRPDTYIQETSLPQDLPCQMWSVLDCLFINPNIYTLLNLNVPIILPKLPINKLVSTTTSIHIQYTALFLPCQHSYSLLSVRTITSADSVTTSADIQSVNLRQSLHQPTPLLMLALCLTTYAYV
jgi:hypothetical protein